MIEEDEYIHRNPLCRHPELLAPSHEPDALHRPDAKIFISMTIMMKMIIVMIELLFMMIKMIIMIMEW